MFIKTKKNKEVIMRFFLFLTVFMLMAINLLLNSAIERENSLKKLYKKGKIEFTQIIKIDNNYLPEGVVFKQLSDFTKNKSNYLFITDNYQNNIKIFNPEGKFIKIIGQKGQGPGDLMWPSSICYNGKYLIVWEQGNNRFSLFSETGDFVKIVKPHTNLQVENIKSISNGNVIVEKEMSQDGRKNGQICILDLYSNDLKLKRTVFKQNLIRNVYLTDPKRIKISVPFNHDVSWNVMPKGHVVIGFQKNYEIGVFDAEKGKLFHFTHQAEPIPITAKDKKRVYDSYRVIVGPGKVKEPPKKLLDKIPFPEFRPAFGKIVVDPENNILVFPMMTAGIEQYSDFDAFDDMGKFINRVEFCSNIFVPIKILYISIDKIWCLSIDSGYEYTIIKYQVDSI